MIDNSRVFGFLSQRQAAGQKCVLVSIVAVQGSSMRDPGTHMGVCEDGSFAGSLSGGCIENAVVAEALAALEDGKARITRFGAGSRYLDIKLPCGGGLDVHFQPLRGAELVTDCVAAIANRKPFSVTLGVGGQVPIFAPHWRKTAFDDVQSLATIGHWPSAKLLVIGHGAVVDALAKLATSMTLDVAVLTPDDRLLALLKARNSNANRLTTPKRSAALISDPWTAIVFLFHDHDWEIELMAQALEQPHFYIGAMGGHKARLFREDALANTGVSEAAISTIRGPIGLFHSARDPDTLALSALGEIIRTYQTTDFSAQNDAR